MRIQATAEKNSAAGVTPAAPWRVKAISALPDYRLAVTFNDGIYSVLADPAVFDQATISLGVVTWPRD